MYNLSPIDPKILIDSIAEKVTANILNAVRSEQLPTQQQEQLLTIQQASEFLNFSVSTLYSKVSKGEITVMKQREGLYFFRNELLDYLKAGKRNFSAGIEGEEDIQNFPFLQKVLFTSGSQVIHTVKFCFSIRYLNKLFL